MISKLIVLGLFAVLHNPRPIFAGENFKLELVQVLFRHGARTPIECEAEALAGVANKSSYAPRGYAQLTNQGMMQEYQIGQMLKERYEAFLPDWYNPDHVYAYASGLSRTKASLELVLAALFPPTEEYTWHPELKWFPIAYHSNPRPLDILVKPRDCPQYIEALRDYFNTAEVKEIAAEHDGIRKTIEGIYGKPFDFGDLFCVYNAFVVQKNMKLPLPDWYTEELFSKLKRASTFYLDALSHTTTLKRLNGGSLVRRLVENIEKSNLKLNQRKIYLYSAHDKTLHAYASSHNLTLPKSPDYGSAIVLEKHRDEQGKYFVKLLLWIGEPKRLSALKLDDCAEYCPLEDYLKLVGPVMPSDEEMLCLLKNLKPRDLEKILTTDTTKIED